MKPAAEGLGMKNWLRGPKQKDAGPKRIEGTTAGRERIAILPFLNISPDPRDEYFADGMTEELISTLSKIARLRVISRTSVMRYKQTAKSVEEISKELNVGSILEGSIRKAADDLRISVKLIDVERDEHVWSQDYERRMGNVFAIQKEIANKVVESLQVKLLPTDKRSFEKQGTSNVKAYELYLKGRFLWNKRSKEGMTEAIEYFKAASQKDRSFALPHVGIADCYLLLVDRGHMASDGYSRAEKEITRALELDENLAEAHASLGLLRQEAYWDWPGAEHEFRKAIELNPSYATAHQWLSILLGASLGRIDEGIVEAKKALELDPLSPVINENIADAYVAIGNLDLAEEHARRSLELDPNFLGGLLSLTMIAVERKSFQEAIGLLEKVDPMTVGGDKRKKLGMAWVYARAGNFETAKRIFEEADAVPGKDNVSAIDVAGYYAFMGDHDKAFELLNQAFENHDRKLCTIRMDPWVGALTPDPRFDEFLTKMKLQ